MAEPQGSLTFVFDENITPLVPLLRASRAAAFDRITDLQQQGIEPGTLDTPMLTLLGQRGRFALIARDGRMLDPLIQRKAWRASGVTLFLLGKQWGNLPLGELARRLLFLWPDVVQHAEQGGQGVAWRVAPRVPGLAANTFRLVTVPPLAATAP